MTQQTINIGSAANDRSGDPLRTAFTKINANFTDLYTRLGADFGNFTISSNTISNPNAINITSGSYALTLGDDGTLNLPLSVNGQGVIQTSGSYYLDANGAVYNLGSNGTFTNPTGGVITDSNSYLTTLNLFVQGSLKGVDGSIGSTGQVLTRQSNGGAAWATPSSGSSSTLVNGSYTLSLASNGVVNVPTSQYNTAQVFASTTNTTMCLGNSSHFIQVRGSDGALVFADYSVQTTAYPGIPGPYASDPVAASNGVAVGKPYYQSSGQVYVRLA